MIGFDADVGSVQFPFQQTPEILHRIGALTPVLEPIFERRFTKDSYACRRGLGTYQALERAKWGVRNFPCVLKCDVRKYFASIDHEILKGLLGRVVKCRPTLDLAARIIDGFEGREQAVYFEGDDLFTPFQRPRGLPLGKMQRAFIAGAASREEIRASIRSWIGHAAFADAWSLRRRLFNEFKFPRVSTPLYSASPDQKPGDLWPSRSSSRCI